MSLVVVGLNHKTAPIALLERLSISEERLAKALHDLETCEYVVEGVILSTCNRIEVYGEASRFHGGAQDLRNFLAEFCHVAPEDFSDHLYTYHDDGALRHLMRVAAGIDSMVIGESEILGQVRRSYQAADDEGVAGPVLGSVFRHALRVGKRARSETAIGRNPVSISSAAVDLASRAFADDLEGKSVAIVGAGKMGRLAMKALNAAGAAGVTIVNRTEERGRGLAGEFAAEARPFDELSEVLLHADIVISSTTAPGTIFDAEVLAPVMSRRESGRPLFIVDIAVPRDVDPSADSVAGVVVRDIEDLRGVVEAGVGSRVGEVARVEEIIAGEVDRFTARERADRSAPAASALVSKVEEIRLAELDRIKSYLDELTPQGRDAVEQMSHRLVAKLLHRPLTRSRTLAASADAARHLDALRELLGIDDD